ncbi:MAG: hypothetical protein CV088_09360 [Nitrospira sp. LK70]|nr:hypothetical protein [Nitrospira sp. LK70]
MPSTSSAKAAQTIAFNLTTDVPLLLLPIRLETRFRGNQLRIRVYPDTVHVDSFERRLTEVEMQWGKRFWQQTQLAKNTDEQRNVWTQLVQVFGTQRAAWIAKQVSTNKAEPLVDPKTAHTPCTDLLPDYWVASGTLFYEEVEQNGQKTQKSKALFKQGRNIKYEDGSDRIFVMPRLDEGLTPDKFKDDPYVGWLVNFAKAEQIGMGLTIDLPGSKWKIDQLFVYGVKASLNKAEDAGQRFEKALEAHHYTQGLAFVSQGTPTNNTISASSGYNSEDVDSFEIERQQVALIDPDSQPNYAVMAEALGIKATHLINVQDALTQEQRAAEEMNRILWQSTWGDFLETMLELKGTRQDEIDKMRDHFTKYVRARGPLPALRIGTQPYGVLPVMALGEAKNETILPDPVACLRALRKFWSESLERVPQLVRPNHRDQQKDNSDRLLQVLAMTPTGLKYVGRNCTRIVAVSSPVTLEDFAKTGRTPLPTELQAALDAMLRDNTVTPPQQTVTPHQRTVFTSPSGLFLLKLPLVGDSDFSENDTASLLALLRDKKESTDHLKTLPKEAHDLLLRETLDLCSHRLDAWITSLATKQLHELRNPAPPKQPSIGLSIGGYGWVENLEPDQGNNNKDPDAYIHAPSLAHATTAAILRSGYLVRRSGDTEQNHDSNALAINLTSDRIRLALHLVDGVRGGQSLGTLLGYRFERALHERGLDGFIPAFRKIAPGSTELITTANPNEKDKTKLENLVLDGLKLLQSSIDWNSSDFSTATAQNKSDMQSELNRLGEALDAVADLVLAESVHHVAQGNPVRAGATLEAITRGETPPPEIEFVRTPRTGINHTHRISVIFGPPPTTFPWGITTPRAQAEPVLNAWVAQLLGSEADKATCAVEYTDPTLNGKQTFDVTIKDLNSVPGDPQLAPLDLVYLLDGEQGGMYSEIEQRIVYHVHKRKPSVTITSLDFARPPEKTALHLGEVLEITRSIRHLITGARALEPRDVQLPEHAASDATLPVDQTLVARATAARDAFLKAIDLLRTKLPEKPEIPLADPTAVRQALIGLASYGLMGSIPSNLTDTSNAAIKQLHAQARAVLSEAQNRQKRAQTVPTSIHTTEQALSVLKEIFGEDFRVLPAFTPENGKDLTQTFAKSPAWQDDRDDPLASITWFQRIARVRDGAARLDTTMQYAEALNGPLLEFQIGQLPYDDKERWVALENPPQGNRLSLACLTTVKDFTKTLAGLLVEEWVESIPNKEEVTGLTFHYDAPQPRAPQALLLALAPDGVDKWDSATLEKTLRETLELAKLRAVDLTALGELGQYLPAMYVDPDKFP